MSLLVLCLGIVFCENGLARPLYSPQRRLRREGIPAVLDADGIEFDERTNVATATGHAVLRYQGVTMNADSLVMYSDTGLVQAFASEGKQVTLERASGERLAGSFLEYHLESSSGFMDKAFGSTKVERGTLTSAAAGPRSRPPTTPTGRSGCTANTLENPTPTT